MVDEVKIPGQIKERAIEKLVWRICFLTIMRGGEDLIRRDAAVKTDPEPILKGKGPLHQRECLTNTREEPRRR